MFTVKSHLGHNMRPGDIFYGYDVSNINMNNDLDDNIGNSQTPDIVLVKKKYNRSKKRIWKLKHINKDNEDVEMDTKGKKDKGNSNKAYDQEMIMRDIEEDKALRKQVMMIKDDAAIKELLEKMDELNVEDKNDPEIDVDINELLDDLNLNDNDKEIDYTGNYENEEEIITEKAVLGKRDREGKNIQEK